MKIEVNKKDLEEALNVASTGLSGTVGEITGHYVFRKSTEEDRVEVLSYNGRIGASSVFECQSVDSEDDEAFTVEGWRLNKWLKACRSDNVKIKSSREKVVVKAGNQGTFQPLDPEAFAFWDDALKDAKLTCTVNASKFRDVLLQSKNFVYEKETQEPKFSVVKAADGVVKASDRNAYSVCTLKGLEKSDFVIHGKDVPTVCHYLQTAGETVELLEDDHVLFIRSRGRDVMSVGRPSVKFPQIPYDMGDEDVWIWDVPTSNLKAAIQQLSAVADKENTKLHFEYSGDLIPKAPALALKPGGDGEGLEGDAKKTYDKALRAYESSLKKQEEFLSDFKMGKVVMSMTSSEGTKDSVDLPCLKFSYDEEFLRSSLLESFKKSKRKDLKELSGKLSKDEMEAKVKEVEKEAEKFAKSEFESKKDLIRNTGFDIDSRHLGKVLSTLSGENVRFHIGVMKKAGYMRILQEKFDTDVETFLTMIAWMR